MKTFVKVMCSMLLAMWIYPLRAQPQLFISEYCGGNPNYSWLELYNPTSGPLDMNGYKILTVPQWTTGFKDESGTKAYTFNLNGTLAANTVYVIANYTCPQEVLNIADTLLRWDQNLASQQVVRCYNGDESFCLYYHDTLVDIIGNPNASPRLAWDVAGVAGATNQYTLLRKTGVIHGNTDWNASRGTNADNSEWIVAGKNLTEYVGFYPGKASHIASLTSAIYHVSTGHNIDTITGISYRTDTVELKNNVTLVAGARCHIKYGINHPSVDEIITNDTLYVIAENNTNVKKYILMVNLAPSVDFSVISDIYTVNSSQDTISDIIINTTASEFLSHLSKAPNATWSISDNYYLPVGSSGIIRDNYNLKVVAEDGTSRMYCLKVRVRLFCEMAQPAGFSPEMPKLSDVCMRLFRLDQPGVSPERILSAGSDFHITRGVWSYIEDKDFIDRVRAKGWVFQGCLNFGLYDPSLALLDREGNPIRTGPGAWNPYRADISNPEYRRQYLHRANWLVDMGVTGFQRDDPDEGFFDWGVKGLRDAIPDAELLDFHRWARTEIEKHAGRKLTFSTNCNTDPPFMQVFDYRMTEVRFRTMDATKSIISPQSVRNLALNARREKKLFVLTGQEDVPASEYRWVYATSYATGNLYIVPWDQFQNVTLDPVTRQPLQLNMPRIFIAPKDFADLTGFVRANAEYLDGYEDAAVGGYDMKDIRYDNELPIMIEGGSGTLSAYVRARPGNADAPVVVHLVERGKGAPAIIKLPTGRFFKGSPLKVRLHVPAPYNVLEHAQAENDAIAMLTAGEKGGPRQAPAYKRLVDSLELSVTVTGEWSEVAVPALGPWGILVVEKGDPHPQPIAVGRPVFTLGETSTRCMSAGTETYTATATNTTGITYSLDAASASGGNSIAAETGEVTYVEGWSGTSIITASAAGFSGPATATHTVVISPTVGTPVFTKGTTSTRLQEAGLETYTATATSNTGITYSLDDASTTGGNSILAETGAVTYVEGWSGTSIITASAEGCGGPVTAAHTVTITPITNNLAGIEQRVMVYPVPFTNFLNIESNEDIKCIEIVSIDGKTIIIRQPDYEGTLQLPTGKIPPGLYVLKITYTEKSTYRKILKF